MKNRIMSSFDCRASSSTCDNDTITSKYFKATENNDSLSDFQQPKKFIDKVTNQMKTRTRNKKSKRIRGQKDIRVVFQSKKNELLAYTEQFSDVCRKTGIDVDSEQLQIAIALSKSLQEPEKDNSNSEPSSQDRNNKIRATLLEYGFKVPEIKIDSLKKKRSRCKNSKLLLISDIERKQIISDKVSQILFDDFINIDEDKNTVDSEINSYEKTYMSYDNLKNNEIFYVEGLIEKSTSCLGGLLKNWSEIPGRPLSPTLTETDQVHFSEVIQSQSDLDLLLSGTFLSLSNFMKKIKEMSEERSFKYDSALNVKSEDVNNKNDGKISLPTVDLRSASPDMFDDEISIIENSIDTTKRNILETKCDFIDSCSQPTSQDNATKYENPMDFTECISCTPDKGIIDLSQTSGESITNIIELGKTSPECVVTSENSVENIKQNVDTEFYLINSYCSQPISQDNGTKYDNPMDFTECIKYSAEEIIDLTHNSAVAASNEINLCKTSSKCTDYDISVLNSKESNRCDFSRPDHLMEITEFVLVDECNIERERDINIKQKFKKRIDDKSVVNLDSDSDSSDVTLPYIDIKKQYRTIEPDNRCVLENIINKTENNECCKKGVNDNTTLVNQSNESIAKDDIVDISNTKSKPNNEITDSNEIASGVVIHITNEVLDKKLYTATSDESNTNETSTKSNIKDVSKDIDLTQELSPELSPIFKSCEPGKFTQVNINNSIDYDEICKVIEDSSEEEVDKESKKINDIWNISDEEIDLNTNISEKSDNEDPLNPSHSDSFPAVQLKDTKRKIKSAVNIICGASTDRSSLKTQSIDTETCLETPSRPEYIVKTVNITPITDYKAMTTPERNKELDKFGLKPLKRKRAIQLLKHLYAQTHPVVEVSEADENILSKKLKLEEVEKNNPEAFKEDNERDTKNIYEITNSVAILGDVDFKDEWVLQKREKNKVKSCTLPLHVAVHNYISSRKKLREAVLRYEPVDVDLVHKHLMEDGHRYDFKEFLKFMDSKCITFKTAQNGKKEKNDKS